MNNQIIESYLNESNKLDGSNYSNWKFKIQTMLEVHNAWTTTNGDEPKPAVGAASVPDWEKREGKAKIVLKMSVKYCIILHIRECKSTSKI